MALNITIKKSGDSLTANELNQIVAAIQSLEQATPESIPEELATTGQPGFHIIDINNNIGLRYDANGLDAAKVSEHFKSLISTPASSNSKWSGKTVNVLGDSNTEFGRYTTSLQMLLQCTLNNYGVAGTRIASSSASDTDSFCARYSDMPACDAVLVMGGTNDWNQAWSESFGTFSDREKTTFCGALHYLFSGLIEKYPNAPIIICTIPHSKNEEYSHITPSQSVSDNGEGITLNHNGKTLDDYSEMIIRVARWYALPVIDIRHAFASGVITRYFSDDVHFNELGGGMIARYIAAHMEIIYDQFYKEIK